MFIYFWPYYGLYHGFQGDKDLDRSKRSLKDEYFYENIGHFAKVIKNFIEKGIKV